MSQAERSNAPASSEKGLEGGTPTLPSPFPPGLTVAQAIRAGAEYLASTSDTARLDAELLMAHTLGVSRSELLLHRMAQAVPEEFSALVGRRQDHEPIAYILGHQEFHGREFVVTTDVLIPRADSESVIGAALEACPAPCRVLDCGVGSGALLLTVLAERPQAEGIGIDNSPGALAVAGDNAAHLGLDGRSRLLQRDWTEEGWQTGLGQFDLILANPPYVETDADLQPSVRRHEPPGALFAGVEGLDDYRVLIPQLPALLSPDGIAVIEIGAQQADAVRLIAERAGFSATLQKDLAGRARALVLRFFLGKRHVSG